MDHLHSRREGLTIRAMFARFRLDRWFAGVRGRRLRVVALRRASQAIFLLLFLFLLLRTEFRGTVGAGSDVQMHWPVRLFFELDPLAALANALATHALYRGLLWSLLILLPVMFLGRFFCGWICPMGTLHHFFGNLRSESKRGKQGVRGEPLQAVAADKVWDSDCGAGGGGVRHGVGGMARPVQPAGAIYGVIDIARRELRGECGAERVGAQWHWISAVGGNRPSCCAGGYGTELQAAALSPGNFSRTDLLILLAANLRVTRFWCRALCPLGALLGVVSQWSIFGLHKDAASCDKCNRCLLHCQGGDDPVGAVPWHKAECLMCMNCLDACPHQSLEFRFFRKEVEVAGPNLPRRKVLPGW